jgi:predicted GH43/DUF377 family glycosyl hydrolase
MSYQLQRYAQNPILSPLPGSSWESEVTTNPAAWLDEATGDILLLYRAAGDDNAHTVRFGLARSKDGYNFIRVSGEPVLSPIPNTPDGGCVEDPRIIKIGDWYHVTVATRAFPPGTRRRLAAKLASKTRVVSRSSTACAAACKARWRASSTSSITT